MESEEKVDVEDIEIDHEEEKVQDAGKRVTREEILREMVVTSNGRDKVFVSDIRIELPSGLSLFVGQETYSIFNSTGIILPLVLDGQPAPSTSVASVMGAGYCQAPPRNSFWVILHKVKFTPCCDYIRYSHSFDHHKYRKLMLLFNWLHPLTQILAQQSVPFSAEVSTEKAKKVEKPFLHTLLYAPPPVLLELVHATADDVYTWSRLGLLGKGIGERAGRFSDWCWLIATLVGLVENGVERQMIGSLQTEGKYVLRILPAILTICFSGRPSL